MKLSALFKETERRSFRKVLAALMPLFYFKPIYIKINYII